jgi:pyruvate/2-oxoglutarate dehydrogenase complex dihydrolipoamide dehydrogenase (E3) component
MNNNPSFDLIVLGSGSGARDGANKARNEFGADVALVESTRWGGSCPNVACKPTKAYLVAAELTHDISTIAAKLGIEVGPARADLARVKARKDQLIVPRETWMERLHGAGHATFDGVGCFVDPETVEVNGDRVSAERILVATGSRTAVPPIEGLDEVGWIDHVSALELTELPESLLVVGAARSGSSSPRCSRASDRASCSSSTPSGSHPARMRRRRTS